MNRDQLELKRAIGAFVLFMSLLSAWWGYTTYQDASREIARLDETRLDGAELK